MAAMNPASAVEFVGASSEQPFQTLGPYEDVPDFGPESSMPGASNSAGLVPSAPESNTLWPPAVTELSPETTLLTPQSMFEDLFSATVSLRPSTAASSRPTRRPSTEDRFTETDPSVIDWTQDELFPDLMGPAFQDDRVYPQLFQGSSVPPISLPGSPNDRSTMEIEQVQGSPVDGYSTIFSSQGFHTSTTPPDIDPEVYHDGNSGLVTADPMLCSPTDLTIASTGLGAFPGPMNGFSTNLNFQASIPSPTSDLTITDIGTRSLAVAPQAQFLPGGPWTASSSVGVIPLHDHVSSTGICHCPHTHQQSTSIVSGIPSSANPSSSSGKGKRKISIRSTAGGPPRLSAREERKLTKPMKCPAPGCGRRYDYKNDLKKHIAAQHKATAHLYGVSADKLPCPYPGCGRLYTRKDNVTRHLTEKHPGYGPDGHVAPS